MVFTVMHLMSGTMLHLNIVLTSIGVSVRLFCENERFYYYHLIIVHTFRCKNLMAFR